MAGSSDDQSHFEENTHGGDGPTTEAHADTTRRMRFGLGVEISEKEVVDTPMEARS